MAFATTTIWDMRNGGSDANNGGGFDPGNTNFAMDLVATGANTVNPAVTSASYMFVTDDIGAWLYIKGGTNWIPGWYQIVDVGVSVRSPVAPAGGAILSAGIGAAYSMMNNVPINPNTVAGCATTASPTGGIWGIDYSQNATPIYSYTDMVIDGTTNTKFTSSAHPVGVNIIGNTIAVFSGSGFTAQTVQVVSVSGTVATCDKSLGTLGSTGGNGGLGGALATLGMCSKNVNLATDNGNTVFVKYSATPTAIGSTANVGGGRWASNNGASIIGWDTNRSFNNTDANRPKFQASANSINMIGTGGGGIQYLTNLIIDGNGHTGCNAINTGAASCFLRCKFLAVANGAFINNTGCQFERCEANSCTVVGFEIQQSCTLMRCSAISCAIGFETMAGFITMRDCTASGSTTAGFQCAVVTNLDHCTAQGTTGGNGFTMGSTNAVVCNNCLAYNNSNEGFHTSATHIGHRLYNCAGGANPTGNYTPGLLYPGQIENFVALTADPFTNEFATPPDLSLNNTAGGGALLRGAGVSTAPVGLAGVSSPDIGSYQSVPPTGSGGVTNIAY